MIKAGFKPGQQRDLMGRWAKTKGDCFIPPINDDIPRMSGAKQKEIINKFSHYRSGDKLFPRTIWADWFLGGSVESKSRIAFEIDNSVELQHALKNGLYDLWTEQTGDNSISFQDFLQSKIKIYRGVTVRNRLQGEIQEDGFTSYTLQRSLAEHFAVNYDRQGNRVTPKIIEKEVNVSELYGALQIVGGEMEVLKPTGYSDKFAQNLYNQEGNKFVNLAPGYKKEIRVLDEAYKIKE